VWRRLKYATCTASLRGRWAPFGTVGACLHWKPEVLATQTLTFLFTDIEGSTAMLARLGEAYAEVLADHHRLIRACLAAHDGQEIDTQGDAFFAVFTSPSGCVAAAIHMQRALLSHAWPAGEEVRVRMGIHSGEASVTAVGPVGLDVHRAARIAGVAHGGQILLSATTAALLGDSMPAGASLSDLGAHRLKDLGRPERLFQLQADGLPAAFPPVRSLASPERPNNLPAPVDSFVGRQRELAEIDRAVRADRLVTLTGPGGSGKTRLALEAAASLIPEFEDGVWLVALAAITDGQRLPEMVAHVLGVCDRPGEAAADTLERWLRDRQLLLILDNCEHVVDAASSFCQRLLPACGRLRILATSREFLGVRGEHAIRTPPLAIPDDPALAPLSDAVQLFLARASAGAPSFRPDDADLGTVMRVCRRLDGLPLAIELAAARLRVLSLSQLAARLDDQFWLLTGASRAQVSRQRTLEAVVAWSYDLLSDVEQRTFARLAVFPGHFTLDMAEAVVSEPPVNRFDVVDIVARLVDKSLVTTVNAPDGLRYQLLEMLRQYGHDRLTERGEADRFRDRLLAWAMSGVEQLEQLESVVRTRAMDDALRQAAIDAVTYRAAGQWAAAQGQYRTALRIASMVLSAQALRSAATPTAS
jgi:predicted ATPase/class 3 adenylate cyclase